MEKEKIEMILSDIFQLDPELKKIKKEIRKIIEEIISSRPEIKIDADFESKLKKEIMDKIAELKASDSLKNIAPKNKSTYHLPVYRLAYVSGLAILVIALVASYGLIPSSHDAENISMSFPDKKPGGIISDLEIEKENSFIRVAKNAFGKLDFSSNETPAIQETGNAKNLSVGSGVGIEPASISGESISFSRNGEDAATDQSVRIALPYEYPSFKYVYEGEEFAQNQESVDVYKRIKGLSSSQSLINSITATDYGLINMAKLKTGAEISNISFNQDKEFGYSVNINLSEGNISLYSNWLKWPQTKNINNIPDNKEIIAIADNFLEEYGINKNDYGAPVIQDYSGRDYKIAASDSSDIYLSNEINVIYPLKINNSLIIDESGNPNGLSITVNLEQKKVSGLYNLNSRIYEVSSYEAITDVEKIISLAEQGGSYPGYYSQEGQKIVTVSLGTPSLVLTKKYKYYENSGISDEFYVPALSFPITNISDEGSYFYRQNIIVPLAIDLISEEPEYQAMPAIDIAPLAR